ncbi:unnamed protein product [Amoebophrya sp. A120]|nr:unnamed protein product [Amoebophrya sp. A120]|eukprot:GSA120T00005661001.1
MPGAGKKNAEISKKGNVKKLPAMKKAAVPNRTPLQAWRRWRTALPVLPPRKTRNKVKRKSINTLFILLTFMRLRSVVRPITRRKKIRTDRSIGLDMVTLKCPKMTYR